MDTENKTIAVQGDGHELTSHERMLIMEGRNLVSRAIEAGITKEVITEHTTLPLYIRAAASTGEDGTMEPSEVLKFVLSARKEWALKGSFILIDGNNQAHRDILAMSFMYRGIVSHAKEEGRLGLTFTMAEVMTMALGMPGSKAVAVKSLMSVPCLWIKDIQPTGYLSSKNSDAKVMFDGVLSARELANRPTIITIDGIIENMMVLQENEWGKSKSLGERYGRKLEQVIVKLGSNEGAWRFRAKK